MSKNKKPFVFYVLSITLFIIGCSSPTAEKESSSYEKQVLSAQGQSNGIGSSGKNNYRKLYGIPEIGENLSFVLNEINIGKTTRGEVEKGICGELWSYSMMGKNDNPDLGAPAFSNISKFGLAAYKDELEQKGWTCNVEGDGIGSIELHFDNHDIVRVIVYDLFSDNDTFYIEEVLRDFGNPKKTYWSFDLEDTSHSSVPAFLLSYPDMGIEFGISPYGIYIEENPIITLVPDDNYVRYIVFYEPLPNSVYRQVYEKGNFWDVDWEIVPAN